MIYVTPLDAETIRRLQALYGEFAEDAKEKYRLDGDPVPFSTVIQAQRMGFIDGYLIEDTAETEPVGFMLFRLEEHRAIEINVIHLRESVSAKVAFDTVMKRFLEDINKRPGWDVVSFALLGVQEQFIRYITWYGFKPVGQAIVKFDFMDSIGVQILQQQQLGELPEGYRLDQWQPQYAGATATNIYEAFCQASDSKWDPRFRTEFGGRKVVHMITHGDMGQHHPQCTSVLLKDEQPVGFCFLVQADPLNGNIPLIGVHPSEKGKGFSHHLLKKTIMSAIMEMVNGNIGMVGIHATLDTDNFPAIKMYRRMGFKEEYNYPHVYLDAERAKTVRPGQWC